MKKTALIAAFGLVSTLLVYSQQDPEAKKILDRVSARSKQYTTIQAAFELKIENRPEKQTSSSKGLLKIKGNKYYMETTDTKVYFDGVTLWTYMDDLNEVTITEPDKDSDDFVENPTILFDFYRHDFKYRLVGETRTDAGWMYEIDLFPFNLDQPYSRFKILIKRDSDELYMVKAVGKDGLDYTAILKDAVYNEPLKDEVFTFVPSKHKGVEIIDMRF